MRQERRNIGKIICKVNITIALKSKINIKTKICIDTSKRDKDYVIELKECLSKNKYLKLESTSFNTDDEITIYNFSKLYSNIPKGMPIANLINTKPSKLQDDTVGEQINTINYTVKKKL